MTAILFSTTNGHNCGDDFIRNGIINLLDLSPPISTLWWNRGAHLAEDPELNKYSNDPEVNLRAADYVIIAGTPEWLDRTEHIYKHCLDQGKPLSIVGVGMRGGRFDKYESLMNKLAGSGLVEICTVRDLTAYKTLRMFGFDNVEIFPDPAFFNPPAFDTEKKYNIFCWRKLGHASQKKFNASAVQFVRKMGKPRIVTVHDNAELDEAKALFPGEKVYYSAEYLDMHKFYSRCKYFAGTRIHGAVMALLAGAGVHLMYENDKANAFHCSVEILGLYYRDLERRVQLGGINQFPRKIPPRMNTIELSYAIEAERLRYKNRLRAAPELGKILKNNPE